LLKASLALVALGCALACGATASAAPARTMSVYFLRGEQLASVSRTGVGAPVAVRKLVAGPTRTEVKKGFRTYVPAGTPIHSVTVAGGPCNRRPGRPIRFREGFRQSAGAARAARPHRLGCRRPAPTVADRREEGIRRLPAHRDGSPGDLRVAAEAGRAFAQAEARAGASPGQARAAGSTAVARLSAGWECRRAPRPGDAGRDSRVPEVGAARSVGRGRYGNALATQCRAATGSRHARQCRQAG
jgi:hypothetical protein